VASPLLVVRSVLVGSAGVRPVARRLSALAIAAASVFVLLPAAAGTAADPKLTAAAAAAQLQTLNTKAETLSEKFDSAQDQLSAAQLRLTADQHQVAAQQVQVNAARQLVSVLAVAAYTSGRLDSVGSLVGESDPTVALQRAAVLGLLTDHQNQTLRVATAANLRLQQAQTESKQQVSAINSLQASLKSQQKVLDGMVAEQTKLLKESETQEQIQAEQAAEAKADAAAQAAEAQQQAEDAAAALKASKAAARPAVAASAPTRTVAKVVAPQAQARATVTTASKPATSRIQSTVPATTSSRAAAVLRYAYAQLGKPYRYGAAGARTFDCSGLSMRAWQAAGVSLSHNAAAQYYSTPHVARSKLEPGDLVYFGFPIHHVGIYIGGGKMIEAPYTGADVRITSFGYRSDYAGASRP
jgi:cell wall-associated NlpC family hydrolase